MSIAQKQTRLQRASEYKREQRGNVLISIRPKHKTDKDGVTGYALSFDEMGKPVCHCPASKFQCVHVLSWMLEETRNLCVIPHPNHSLIWFVSGVKDGRMQSHRVEKHPMQNVYRCDCGSFCLGISAVIIWQQKESCGRCDGNGLVNHWFEHYADGVAVLSYPTDRTCPKCHGSKKAVAS